MRQDLKDKIKFLVGDEELLEEMSGLPGKMPFDPETVEFLDAWSRLMRKDSQAKKYSDVQTFAFWCRKASVLRMKGAYDGLSERVGRGLTFHIAPSNIPMMFCFSLAVSLLAGNANLIRISSRDFEQSRLVCRLLSELLEDYPEMRKRIVILRCAHEEELTAVFSAFCDSRMIWGGNRSIMEIRKAPLPPYGIDLPFYDRFSFSVIDSEKYLSYERKKELAEKFYNDTYLTDQNACTSPQLVVWLGRESGEARRLFWEELEKVVKIRYSFQNIQGVDKLAAAARYAIAYGDGKMVCSDRVLCRVEIKSLHEELKNYRCPGGYFYEYQTTDLREIRKVCTRDCQTLSYFGLEREELVKLVKGCCRGVDRIVPIGSTMDFGLKWDGFDLITSLSKVIG